MQSVSVAARRLGMRRLETYCFVVAGMLDSSPMHTLVSSRLLACTEHGIFSWYTAKRQALSAGCLYGLCGAFEKRQEHGIENDALVHRTVWYHLALHLPRFDWIVKLDIYTFFRPSFASAILAKFDVQPPVAIGDGGTRCITGLCAPLFALSCGTMHFLRTIMHKEGGPLFCSDVMDDETKQATWLGKCLRTRGARIESGGPRWLGRFQSNITSESVHDYNDALHYAGVFPIKNATLMLQWQTLEHERRLRLAPQLANASHLRTNVNWTTSFASLC